MTVGQSQGPESADLLGWATWPGSHQRPVCTPTRIAFAAISSSTALRRLRLDRKAPRLR
jgi:hypothetical protein